ncbi:MAG: AAA family ATPase [Spirochaetaceae bacterium]|nr:AAA family ATPase [Spirochaetaceae bacterium]
MLDNEDICMYEVIGENFGDCLEKLKRKQGHDYLIKGQSVAYYGGFLGFGQKKGYKITYCIPSEMSYRRAIGAAVSYGSPYGISGTPSNQTTKPEDFTKVRDEIIARSPVKPNPQLTEILDKISSLEDTINAQARTVETDEHPTVLKIQRYLEENEFSLSFIRSLSDRIKKEFSLEELENFELVEQRVIDWIGEGISVVKPHYTARPQVIVLIGPTGVGKTTTVAKIAAKITSDLDDFGRSKSVHLITIDNFRIAAKQQIESYGDIMRMSVSFADSLEKLQQILQNDINGVDFVLIDTVGYSPNDYENIAKMRRCLDIKGLTVEYYLTLAASTKLSDMRNIMQQYEAFGYKSVIVTKMDETKQIGNVLSVLQEKNKSLAYITTGQSVPRHIEEASIVKMLTYLTHFKIHREHIEEKFLLES